MIKISFNKEGNYSWNILNGGSNIVILSIWGYQDRRIENR